MLEQISSTHMKTTNTEDMINIHHKEDNVGNNLSFVGNAANFAIGK